MEEKKEEVKKSSGKNIYYTKTNMSKTMLVIFRQILYDRRLHSSAKVLAFAILDTPRGENQVMAKIGRKLGVTPPSLSKWKKELSHFSGFSFPANP
jgi:hypothetical protein